VGALVQLLASVGDDRRVVVWRVSDWSVVTVVQEPYLLLQQPSQTHRLSWAPDGQSLVTTNGFRDVRPVAPVLVRGSWVTAANLVGHARAVGACRFNPHLTYVKEGALEGSPPVQTCCAIGGNDGAVTIWTQFNNGTALVALSELFEFPVSDISWCAHASTCGDDIPVWCDCGRCRGRRDGTGRGAVCGWMGRCDCVLVSRLYGVGGGGRRSLDRFTCLPAYPGGALCFAKAGTPVACP
jgi:hypothetical protein